MFGGLLSLAGRAGPPVWAASPQDATLTVRPFAGVPPASIGDLTANPGTVDGQLRLQWTAPTVMAGSSLDSYQIRVQTFSLASVGGSTTTWWNASGGFLIQGLYGESPGQAVTRTLGPPGSGSSHSVGLSPGGVYYVAVRSADDLGTPLDFWSNVTQVVQGTAFVTGSPSTGTPLKPNGLSMSLSGAQFTFNWHPVTRDTNGNPISIDHYTVYRYDTIGSSPTASTNITGGATSFSDIVGGLTYFYRVVAVATGGTPSSASDYVDSSNVTNRYAIAGSDLNTRVVLPGSLAKELNSEFNGTSDDYEIVALRQQQNENATTLKSYLFQVQNARTGQVVFGFTFSQPIAEIQVSYALSVPTLGLSQRLTLTGNTGAEAQAIAQLISLYWFNGGSFIRVGGTVILQNQALAVSAKNLGLYEIRAVSAPQSFGLTRGSPYPRVIAPNASENRRVFWFFDNPGDEEIIGTIYDIRGAKVRDLRVDGLSPTSNSLVWDGRDSQGSVVPSGVYIYEIKAGKERVTGTVVVAR